MVLGRYFNTQPLSVQSGEIQLHLLCYERSYEMASGIILLTSVILLLKLQIHRQTETNLGKSEDTTILLQFAKAHPLSSILNCSAKDISLQYTRRIRSMQRLYPNTEPAIISEIASLDPANSGFTTKSLKGGSTGEICKFISILFFYEG